MYEVIVHAFGLYLYHSKKQGDGMIGGIVLNGIGFASMDLYLVILSGLVVAFGLLSRNWRRMAYGGCSVGCLMWTHYGLFRLFWGIMFYGLSIHAMQRRGSIHRQLGGWGTWLLETMYIVVGTVLVSVQSFLQIDRDTEEVVGGPILMGITLGILLSNIFMGMLML